MTIHCQCPACRLAQPISPNLTPADPTKQADGVVGDVSTPLRPAFALRSASVWWVVLTYRKDGAEVSLGFRS